MREMEVPSVFEGGFNNLVEVANLEAPGIIVVDHLVDRVQGVHVWRQQMMRRLVSEDAKAVIDGHIIAKWFNVDLEDDRTDATWSWRSPTWWSKEWRDHVLGAIIISGRRTGTSVRRSHRGDRLRGTGETITIQVSAKRHDKRLRTKTIEQ